MASGNQNAADGTASSESSGGGWVSKVVMALSILNVIATSGMFAVLYLSFQREKQNATVGDISPQGTESETPAEHGEAHGEGHGEKADAHKGGEGKSEGGKEGASEKSSTSKMVTLEQFTVNLTTPGSSVAKFVRVNISIEVPTEDTETEVNVKMPQVRNVIIDLFNSKRPADIATAEGREYIKDEIKNTLNSFLISGKVKGVFFTSFALAG